jgi:hypothetical protein
LIQAVVSSDALACQLLGVLSWLVIAVALRVGFETNRLQLSVLTLLFITANSFLLSLSGQRMLDFYAAVALAFAAYGWWVRRHRSALLLMLTALLGLGIWAAFLTWQDHGWEAFLGFAKNRSNSGGLTIWQRGAKYLAFIYGHSHGSDGLVCSGGVWHAVSAGNRFPASDHPSVRDQRKSGQRNDRASAHL